MREATRRDAKVPPAVVIPQYNHGTVSEPVHFHRNVYDMLIARGPSTRDELRQSPLLYTTESWRDFQARHPEHKKTSPSLEMLAVAEEEQLDLALIHGTEMGWLVRSQNGVFSPGKPPPDHVPLYTLSYLSTPEEKVEAAAKKIQSADNTKAFNLLRNEKLSRRPPTDDGKKQLRESIKRIGQLNPIIRWHRTGLEEIVVDGVTRLEVLGELGIEPLFFDLPSGMEPWEVLGRRIAAELDARSTKKETEEARDDYIRRLTEAGVTQQGIADILAMTQKNVSLIQARLAAIPKGRPIVPSEKEIDEWVDQAAQGWTFEQMSVRSGWSRGVIHKHLQRRAGEATGAKPKIAAGTRVFEVLQAVADLGNATDEELDNHLGVYGRDHRRAERRRLAAEGLIKKTMVKGQSAQWQLTEEGESYPGVQVTSKPKLTIVPPVPPAPAPRTTKTQSAPRQPAAPQPPQPPAARPKTEQRALDLLVRSGHYKGELTDRRTGERIVLT